MHLRMGCCLLAISFAAISPGLGSAEDTHPKSPVTGILGMVPNERDLGPYRQKGRASIAGQAFLATRLNKVVVQPGGVVLLLPVTRQTREWFERVVQRGPCAGEQDSGVPSGKEPPTTNTLCGREAVFALLADKGMTPYLRTTRTNPTGHFWLTKLPAGRYYIVSPIAGGSDHGRELKADSTAWTTVEIEWGEKLTNVVVTDQSRE